jgi:hypothetical protein
MWNMMTIYVIMHNMIVEAEHNDIIYDQSWDSQGELVDPEPGVASWDQFVHVRETLYCNIQDRLQIDLIQHI